MLGWGVEWLDSLNFFFAATTWPKAWWIDREVDINYSTCFSLTSSWSLRSSLSIIPHYDARRCHMAEETRSTSTAYWTHLFVHTLNHTHLSRAQQYISAREARRIRLMFTGFRLLLPLRSSSGVMCEPKGGCVWFFRKLSLASDVFLSTIMLAREEQVKRDSQCVSINDKYWNRMAHESNWSISLEQFKSTDRMELFHLSHLILHSSVHSAGFFFDIFFTEKKIIIIFFCGFNPPVLTLALALF